MADEGLVSSTMFAPADPQRRIEAIDVVRGVAVLGIFAMNVAVFAAPFAAYSNPTMVFPYEGLNRWAYWVVHTVFDMKMMSIFSMLFGAGAIMYAEKASERLGARAACRLWMRRMLWLLLIGMVHAYLIWEGDILVSYAIVGLAVMWWVRRLPPWSLLALSGAFFVVSMLGMLFLGWWVFVNEHPEIARAWHVPETAIQSMTEGDSYAEFRQEMAPNEEKVAELTRIYRDGWVGIFWIRAATAMQIQLFMLPMMLFWRAGSMMLLGAVLYKTQILTGARSSRFYLMWTILFYVVGLPMVIGGIVFNESHGFDLGWFHLWGMAYNTVGSVFVALGHVGLFIWLLKVGALGHLGRALAAVGRMALTNYLAQSILGSVIFYGYGLGLYGSMDRVEQQVVVLATWALMLIWSPLWLSRFRFGPAEWLWRSLTYRQRQALRARA